MNQMVIQVFETTNFNITTRNFYLTGRMTPLTFYPLVNTLVLNGGNPIQITRGTYSADIAITPPPTAG
jgi:hypothetical protein